MKKILLAIIALGMVVSVYAQSEYTARTGGSAVQYLSYVSTTTQSTVIAASNSKCISRTLINMSTTPIWLAFGQTQVGNSNFLVNYVSQGVTNIITNTVPYYQSAIVGTGMVLQANSTNILTSTSWFNGVNFNGLIQGVATNTASSNTVLVIDIMTP
jgi:hypothetical protein